MKEIPLSNSVFVAQVDDEDYPLLSRISWYFDSTGYAQNLKFRMHRLILGFPGSEIDHIDRNKLNNQKANLRLATRQCNQINCSPSKANTSGFKGVNLSTKILKPWRAYISRTTNGKKRTHNLGYFATAEEAARAYDAKARELYGEYAYQNFPEGQE